MIHEIKAAFLAAAEGFAPDRVIADPEVNARFLRECRRLGLSESDRNLNLALLNARKLGHFKGLKCAHRTVLPDQEAYRYAAEVAARHLERRHDTALDVVLCDPALAAEFDGVARSIAPGHTVLAYRYAALALRKTSHLKPEILARVVRPQPRQFGPVSQLDYRVLPVGQGLYIFHSESKALYIGESSALRSRIEQHLDHSDNKGLAHWLWSHGGQGVMLEAQVLPDDTPTKIRRALELELIRSRNPEFNVKR